MLPLEAVMGRDSLVGSGTARVAQRDFGQPDDVAWHEWRDEPRDSVQIRQDSFYLPQPRKRLPVPECYNKTQTAYPNHVSPGYPTFDRARQQLRDEYPAKKRKEEKKR